MNILDNYGSMVFGDSAMKKYLPENVYLRLKKQWTRAKASLRKLRMTLRRE